MVLNRLKGFFSCGQLLGCCTNSVQGIWVVTEACIVLTPQPGLCRPTEAVVFVWDRCRCLSILQSLFLYSLARLSCALLQEVCRVCISCLPPETEHSGCTFTAAQISTTGHAPFTTPPSSTRAGGKASHCCSAPDRGICFTGGLRAGTKVQSCLCLNREINI